MEQPIRVLCVFAKLDRGGSETMCMELYRNIDRSKVQFDFVKHYADKGAYEDEITSLGGRIFQAPRFSGLNYFTYCSWWKEHFALHPEHCLIHGHYFTISAIYFKIAKMYDRITIGHSHASPFARDYTLKDLLERFLCGRVKKYSDYAFACSNLAGNWMFPKGYKVLKNAIETNRFKYNIETRQKIRSLLKIDKSTVIGTVGRLSAEKNPFFIIDMIEELLNERNDIKFLWVGDGNLKEQIISEIKRRELDDFFILTGVVSNVQDYLQAMDAFVLPSLFEGLGIVAIEAQTSGLYCLVSEELPEEAIVTNNCKKLPINDHNIWVDDLSHLKEYERSSKHDEIINAGYDIHDTSIKLQSFYQQIFNK